MRFASGMSRVGLLVACVAVWPIGVRGASAETLEELDIPRMQQFVNDHDKVILYVSNGACAECDAVAQTLASIATHVPDVPIARIDGSRDGGKLASHFGAPAGSAVLRALFRNAPPGKRVLAYAGPIAHDPVMEWCRSVAAWTGGEELPVGWTAGGGDGQQGSMPSVKVTEKAEL
ncbi:hypothetical protein AB1Y20_007634 [Prymnesium parvum]|uniref:Glutaredoxin-like protein n=1 Tax=Prymnesium parvum TaxID=97485 RepID=A0AB34IYJ2_PRYPA